MSTVIQNRREIQRTAVLSPCEQYRYLLSRVWDETLPRVTFVMMNPSTADALVDDATIRKCIGFAERWGFGAIDVVNLFAFRSRDPLAVGQAPDPIGPEYAKYFDETLASSSLVIAAWGCESTLNKSRLLRARSTVVTRDLSNLAVPVQCLGMSKKGTPYHPLMLAYVTERIPYNPYEEAA